jgi:D-glycero-alpha-D-manno-heptose-7-phosphate kinase
MMSQVDELNPPLLIVNALAPIRICDNGGWTDTWFAGHGKVFNIAVHPCVEVQIRAHPLGALPERIVLDAENYGERYMFKPGVLPDRHPLLEATIDEMGVPDDVSIEISIFSEAPAGGSTGTSASVTVALVAALDALASGRLTPHQMASIAHRIEVERLGIQSGIQDQLCAAFGGINYIEIPDYPRASVSPITVPDTVWWELDRRLVLVFLGHAHVSSDIHDRVIAGLAQESRNSPSLETLRRTAEGARDAVLAADFAALGRAMIQNTLAQETLRPSLIGEQAQRAIEIAAAHGAMGWKLNGAGGDGGSITLLCGPDMSVKRRMLDALRDADALFEVIPTHLSRHGVRVWHT